MCHKRKPSDHFLVLQGIHGDIYVNSIPWGRELMMRDVYPIGPLKRKYTSDMKKVTSSL